MKILCVLLVASAALTVHAQSPQPLATAPATNIFLLSTNWPAMTLADETPLANPPTVAEEAFAARITRYARESFVIPSEFKPNEITVGKFTYSGIAVEIAKMPNPLQLLNPFAPEAYGSAEINLVRDPSGHPSGLKFFSLQF